MAASLPTAPSTRRLGTVLCSSAPLFFVFLAITRSFHKRSRRDLALLHVLKIVKATSGCHLACQLCLPLSLVLLPDHLPRLGHPHQQWGATGLRLLEQGYRYLSHRHHVVLGADDDDRFTFTISEAPRAHGLIITFLFSSLALNVNTCAGPPRPSIPPYVCPVPTPDPQHTLQPTSPPPQNLSRVFNRALDRALRVSGD